MLGLLFAIAALTQGPPSSGLQLSDVPNTTVRYYDVEGKDATSINRSIARARPPVNGKPRPASAEWTIKAGFQRHTQNGVCRVSDAEVTFAATAELPRLVNEQALAPAVLAKWRQYVQRLEANELPTLIFVQQQIGEVRKAILASSCEEARDTIAHVVGTLKGQAAAFEIERQRKLPRTELTLDDGGTNRRPAEKTICKNLLATGSRLNSIRICMVPREWAILHQSGEEATKEMQNKPRVNAPF